MIPFSQARAKIGGMRGLLTALGDAPTNGNWKSMPQCPFCKARGGKAGIYNKSGEFFRCHHPGCDSGNVSLAEVAYVAAKFNLSTDKPTSGGAAPAYQKFMEIAGCWEEQPKREEKKPKPAPPREPLKTETSPAEKPVENPAGDSPAEPPPEPQRYNPTIVPPTPATVSAEDEEMLIKCIEVIRVENKASTSLLQRVLGIGYGRADRMMEELQKRGIVGPKNGQEPREILKLPDRPPGWMVVKMGAEIHIEKPPEAKPIDAPTLEKPPEAKADEAKSETKGESKPKDEKPEEKSTKPLGMESTEWFFAKLFPTRSQVSAYLDKPIQFCDKCGIIATTNDCKKCGGETKLIEKVPDPLPAAIAKRLRFQTLSMFAVRGITDISCDVLALRANPPENEAVLRDMDQEFPWEEVRASGLWLDADRKTKLPRRPNAQFHGKGQIGKKPERERKSKDDKWVWSFNMPVIIPYFNEAGDLIKLRPHKGGAPAGTISGRPRIYVPRDRKKCADVVEKFFTVVICEGEYKAIALWQTIGAGAVLQMDENGKPILSGDRFEAVGVCALPGISYVTNAEMMMDLERWLKDVGCRRVIVAFDDEDKSDRPLRMRFDAPRDARVLAIRLAENLHVESKVCILPREWRNSRGKADWDGALQKIVNPKI